LPVSAFPKEIAETVSVEQVVSDDVAVMLQDFVDVSPEDVESDGESETR